MWFSLKNDKGQYLLNTDYGYSFIDPDRTHKHYTNEFWFGFWECVRLIWENPEDKLRICRKVRW